MPNRVVLALSGGVDSVTTLAYLLDQGYQVHCVLFQYGSKHNTYELRAASKLVDWFSKEYPDKVQSSSIDISPVFQSMNSNLLQSSQRQIPEGYYTNDSMSQTVVPARNIIFLSVMAGIAKSQSANLIALGIHQGDHAIYADCRTEFYKAMDAAIFLGTDRQVEIIAPFVDCDKTDIVQWGLQHSVPYKYTRTCYKQQELSCSRCGACRERLEAFRRNNVIDPIPYEIPLGVM